MLFVSAACVCVFYALLWSAWWYPLSDSALYLNMARALARGGSLESVRQMHRDVRPLTPLLFAAIMKLGGGIGTMHAATSGLTLVSHLFAFLTLRRWFGERTALFATLATATSWWVYANAFTLMTEPMFLAFLWAAMWGLGNVRGKPRSAQWAWIGFAVLMMAGAWGNRVAAALSLPGMMFGLWMSNRDVPAPTRAAWVAAFAVLFAGLVLESRRATPASVAPTAESVAESREETYHLNVLVGVKRPLDLPVAAGRWVGEVLAAPMAVPFEMSSKSARVAAGIGSVVLFVIACVGWVKLWRGRRWYAVGMALYFLPYLILWGARIKPRYMTPIAPVLFVQVCLGVGSVVRFPSRPRDLVGGGDVPHGGTYGIGCAFLLAVNLVPYAVEVYIRHVTPLNFYDAARRGAFAELVDIGAYVEAHAAKNAVVAVNWPPPSSRPPDAVFAPDRRIVQFLCDRDVLFSRGLAWVRNPGDPSALDAFFATVAGDWAIVYYGDMKWPSYHLPIAKAPDPDAPPRWWGLYHRDPATNAFVRIAAPRNREKVRGIPGWGILSVKPNPGSASAGRE